MMNKPKEEILSNYAPDILQGVRYAINNKELPQGFVYLSNYAPDIIQEVRYATNNNFVGRKIAGYNQEVIIVTEATAKALASVQEELVKKELLLKVFDGYRPHMACLDFWQWAASDDNKMQSVYYPSYPDKRQLFEDGLISKNSNHCRGSTVDLTIVNLKTGEELDMGGIFDYFGEVSYTESSLISEQAKQNRFLLKNYMTKHGFNNYEKEWWHYELANEPFSREEYPEGFNFFIE